MTSQSPLPENDEPRPAPGEASLLADLKSAIRRARLADAERSGAIYDLRGAQLARLEVLEEALAPLYASLPSEIDLFDHGIIPSEQPRLYVDIVAFVEMARDNRSYRFVLDTHEGRIALGESADVAQIKQLVIDHVARRLLAREKALASSAYPTGMLSGSLSGTLAATQASTDRRALSNENASANSVHAALAANPPQRAVTPARSGVVLGRSSAVRSRNRSGSRHAVRLDQTHGLP